MSKREKLRGIMDREIMTKSKKTPWERDEIQFPRLIWVPIMVYPASCGLGCFCAACYVKL